MGRFDAMPRRNAVVVIADEYQFAPAAFLARRLRLLNTRDDVDILLGGNSKRSLEQARGFDCDLLLLDLTELEKVRSLPTQIGITSAAYLRLFLPRLLAKSYGRILYLDADIYAESAKVFELFDLDMGDHAIAGVRDLNIPFVPNKGNALELRATFGLSEKDPPERYYRAKYMNTGVSLYDADAFIDAGIEKKALAMMPGRIPKPIYVDQTVTNAVLRGDWLELSPAFNMIVRAWASFIRAFVAPVLVHFTGGLKPWHRAFVDDHPIRRELPLFLKSSPWADFILRSNPTLISAGGPPPAPQLPHWNAESLAELLRYLRETRFADVEQGLTNPSFAALPA
jgi:lipopolysaccharide biosynthesis glycosyltransferase